jgi:hypothetical protein
MADYFRLPTHPTESINSPFIGDLDDTISYLCRILSRDDASFKPLDADEQVCL